MEAELQYCKGHPDVRHVDIDGGGCHGQLAITGDGYYQMPAGVGFPASGRDVGRFVIDTVRYPTYHGFCLKCGAKGQFIRLDAKPTRHRIRKRRT